MKKQKTRKEPEVKFNWKLACIVLMCLLMWFFLTLLIFPSLQYKYRALEQQLSECQEQVPVWTLKVECIGHELANYIYFEDNYTDYELYQEVIKQFDDLKEFENCEVLSND